MDPEVDAKTVDAAQRGKEKPAARPFWRREQYLGLGTLALVIAMAIVIFWWRDRLLDLELYMSYGYIGVFVLSFLNTASPFFPVAGIVAVFLLGGILSPPLLALVAGAGMALGEMTGYLVGCGGRGLLENRHLYLSVEGWMSRWGSLAIFLFAFFPNPIFKLGGAACGVLRFPSWKFVLFVFLGRTLRCLGIAYAGALSLPWIVDLLTRFL